MPRRNDIESAFRAAMEIDKSGRRVVTTRRFIGEFDDSPVM